MIIICYFICYLALTKSDPVGRLDITPSHVGTRRILNGKQVDDTRSYMVYLRPAEQANPLVKETNWLCGGVIVHERYIITSAACIEDARNFYVISGTNKWTPINEENECIQNGAKKAIWKCIAKNYNFDGMEFDNYRWIGADIAVVKVEDSFNFESQVVGCDYVPTKIPFNNVSKEFEKPGTVGSIAGWGSIDKFGDIFSPDKPTINSPVLLETNVQVISLKACKSHWDPRYHLMMDQGIFCTRDTQDDTMSVDCIERGVDCKELIYSKEYDEETQLHPHTKAKTRRLVMDPRILEVHEASHSMRNGTRRTERNRFGGFCENDHGGPFIVGDGKSSMIVGIMAACLTKDITKMCYGPFMYTSIWHYRHLISCAIDKELGQVMTCRRSLEAANMRMEEFSFDWTYYPDGPAKSVVK